MTEIPKQLRLIADQIQELESQISENEKFANKDSGIELIEIVSEIVNYLQPLLEPYEIAYYWHMFNRTVIENKTQNGVFSTRGLGIGVVKSVRSDSVSYGQVASVLKSLEEKGVIMKSGEPDRDGTPYRINLPEEIEICRELMKKKVVIHVNPINESERLDYYNVRQNRTIVFERDSYKCYKCGKQLTRFDATLDHLVPVSKGGDNSLQNLMTCCLHCNSKRRNKDLSDHMPMAQQVDAPEPASPAR